MIGLIVLLIMHRVRAEPSTMAESEVNRLMKTILSTYDKSERAQIDNQLNVTVNFYVQDLSAVREVNMDYQITMFFRQVRPLGFKKGWKQILVSTGLDGSTISIRFKIESNIFNSNEYSWWIY